MEDTKIQWHPGFVAAMGMEFREDMEALDFKFINTWLDLLPHIISLVYCRLK